MYNHKATTKCVNCFKSLGVEARSVIYFYLKQNTGVTVGELVNVVGLTQPTVSYHLKQMHNCGLLKSKKVSKEVYYSVNSVCPHDKSECILKGKLC